VARLADLPGLGVRSEAWLAEVGVTSEDELRRLGALVVWRRLKHWNPRLVTMNALYALHGAINGLPWRAVDAATKARLRAEAEASGPIPSSKAGQR
jgi:DNA transformation protein